MHLRPYLPCVFALLALAACGGETSSSGGGGNGPTGPECEEDADCPKGPCENPVCNGGTCGTEPKAEGTEVELQNAADCLLQVCDGAGNVTEMPDDTDAPSVYCGTGACVMGEPTLTPNDGDPCPDDDTLVCGFDFDCVECTTGAHCMTGICDAQEGSCSPETCGNTMLDGQETDVDCGGDECPSCGVGLNCVDDNDCLSDNCDNDTNTCDPNN